MNPELSKYITSFSNQSRRTIQSVLSQSVLEKSEIGQLIKKLSTFNSTADYSPIEVAPMQPVQREIIVDMFRDMDLRIKSQFDISNSLSLLSSSMSNIFGGELQKIEKDLQYLNSYVDNYSFISGEDDLYNDSFIENFDTQTNSYKNQSQQIQVPDRNNIPFLDSENAVVDQFSGVLKFSNGIELIIEPIQKEDIKEIYFETNFNKQYISSDTGIEKILNNINSKSWSLTVKTPFVITDNLLDNEKYSNYKNGITLSPSAQIAVSAVFNRPIKMSKIRLNPNYVTGMQIGQIIVETDLSPQTGVSSSVFSKKGLLNAPVVLDLNSDIDFDQTYSIKSITIILAQTNYKRIKITPIQTELNSKLISEIIKTIRDRRKEKHDSLQDYVIKFFLQDTEKFYLLRNKKLYSYNYTQYYPTRLSETNFGVIEKLDRNKYFSDIDSFNKFKNTSFLSNIIFSIVSYSLGSRLRNQISSTYIESNIKDSTKSLSNFSSGGFFPLSDSNIVDKNIHFYEQSLISINKNDATETMNSIEESNMYEYSFSIKNVAFYTTNNTNLDLTNIKTKSFFMSKKIPTNGRPMRVKMLAEYFPELKYSTASQEMDKTSIEFSVCINDDPSLESNWTPIMPYKDSGVRTELFFPNSIGEGSLRFEPLPESVVVYCDQKPLISGAFNVTGKILKINLDFNINKVYFVSYTPKDIKSAKEVLLHANNMSSPVLASPNFNGTNGEYFSGTGSDLKIRLSYNPYIDQTKYAGASYSDFLGTIALANTSFGNFDHSSYSPVKVVLNDGTTAINITNYILSDYQIENFYETDNILFIHSGDTLLFNKEIKTGFRVMYQYMPDSFRYRVILRSLTADPQNYSVDRLIFKFSTESNDKQLTNLIKYDNVFKNKMN